jgi:HPt (histidine-containing phosphotransfer) domain-containing protein
MQYDVAAAVRGVFLRRVNEDAFALAEHQSMLKHGTAAPSTLAGIRDIAHGLAGSGSTFGYPGISAAAAALEQAVVVALDGSDSGDAVASALDRLLAFVETIRIH